MIGRLSKDLGMLPSQVELQATTYDIMVMDVLNTYENYQQQKANGKVDPSVFQYTQDELKAMMEKSRG
jgi:hypothetical protein